MYDRIRSADLGVRMMSTKTRYPKAVLERKHIDYDHKLDDEARKFLKNFNATEYAGDLGEGPDARARKKIAKRNQWLARTDAMAGARKDDVDMDNMTAARTSDGVEDALIEAIDTKRALEHAREDSELRAWEEAQRARDKRIAEVRRAGGRSAVARTRVKSRG